MKKIAIMSLVASSVLMAGGYKIPETSTNAVALGAANVAHNHNNADAAYYNPAKMVFMSDENHIEADLMYVKLEKVKYQGDYTYPAALGGTTIATNTESEEESFLIPSLHFVSKKLGESDVRVGLSITTPGGLSKRWSEQPAKLTAEEFTLETVEVNPTAAFSINEKMAVAVGFRILYSKGISDGMYPGVISQSMTGDSIDFGYNLAFAYNPTDEVEIGLTYRSKINMSLEGDADLFQVASMNPEASYVGSVEVPLPAALNVAAAYTFPTETTVEIVYERTYWSAYTSINFEYTDPTAEFVFGSPKNKDWHDTNTFRLGLTQKLDDLTLMAGLVIDETPVPDDTLGFDLPDTDSTAISFGGRYKVNDKVDVGLSALYSMHDDRKVQNDSLDGEFTDGNVLIISAGLGYKF